MLSVEGNGLRKARLQWDSVGMQGLRVVSRQSQSNFQGVTRAVEMEGYGRVFIG